MLRFILFYSVVLYFIKSFYIAELHVTWLLFHLKSVSQKTLYGEWHRICHFIWRYFCLHWIISIYLQRIMLKSDIDLYTLQQYIIYVYIYMSLRKWIWIKTCLQDSRSPPELLFRFFDGSSSCKWTFLPVRWKFFAPQNQKLTPLTKGVLQVFIILEFFALSFSRIFQCVTFELVVST